MKRLHIGAASVLTGDELADVVMDLAMALYDAGRVESVGIPIVDEGGEAQRARLLLTPAMSLWVSTVAGGNVEDEPSDPSLVLFLRDRCRELTRIAERDERLNVYQPLDPFDL
jgi:hypothetical protein